MLNNTYNTESYQKETGNSSAVTQEALKKSRTLYSKYKLDPKTKSVYKHSLQLKEHRRGYEGVKDKKDEQDRFRWLSASLSSRSF